LFKKDKKIIALQQRIEELHEEADNWRDTCRWLEARTEKLCQKYLALHSKKDNEVMFLAI
jgi:cupin superfamily acireductone dioxygenase involved in methionine salvage